MISLDKISADVLDVINRECADGGYKVLSLSDIAQASGRSYKPEGVLDAVHHLAEKEFIKLKYADEINVCVAGVPKGRVFVTDYRKETREKRKRAATAVIAFVGALLGAFAGTVIANLLF